MRYVLLLLLILFSAGPSLAVNPDDYIDSDFLISDEVETGIPTSGITGVGSHKAGEIYTEPETGMEFVWIPGGCYQMGSEEGYRDEKPIHKVCVDGFWMGRYEVTNAQFRKFSPSHDSKDYFGRPLNGDSQPVVMISWQDAKDFAKWLTDKSSGRYRLPTEAEWEYAARAGSQDTFFWGDSERKACEYANVHDRVSKKEIEFSWKNFRCDDGYAVTSPVGKFKPNKLGLYDMTGNVFEWCEDILI